MAVASYPVEAAATRYRLQLYVAPLAARGITVTIHPFFDREAFAGFDFERVASFTEKDVDRLLTNAGIIRHRGKITATITNARATIALREEGGLVDFVWGFQPADTPRPHDHSQVPTVSDESKALSKALRKKGFAFVGPTTMYALMEAVGIVDTHLMGSHRRGSSGVWPA